MLRTRDDGYQVDDDAGRLDLGLVVGFLQTTYWSGHRRRATIERAISRSLAAGLYAPGGAQCGFARVAGDATTFAWLADVFVLPEQRGRGLARFLVGAVLEHPELAGVERWMLATADAHGVYEPLGFTALEDPSRYLVRRPHAAGPAAQSSSGPGT